MRSNRDERDQSLDVMRGVLCMVGVAFVVAGLVLGLTRPSFDGLSMVALFLIGAGGALVVRITYGSRDE